MTTRFLAINANPLLQQSARQMADGIAKRRFSAVDLVEASLQRAQEINPDLNAFCMIDERAINKARQADRAVQQGRPIGPLHGVPFAVKDLTPTKGHLTTLGSWSSEHWVPDHTALCVERLEQAGAIIIGKTTTPEFAFSAFTQSPRWGITRNPWNPLHTSGGSSGGSAVAVATGCVPFAEGTDMGGSIRIPAACCGIVGLKPGLGRIPMTILPTLFDTISHFGPLARTVDDALAFIQVAAGPSDEDIMSQIAPFVMPAHPKPLSHCRFACSLDQGYYQIDPGVARQFEAAIDLLKQQGAQVEPVSLNWTRDINDQWYDYWCVYMATFFGDRLERWQPRMDPNVAEGIIRGTTISGVAFKGIERLRTKIWQDMACILAQADFFITPTCAITAPLARQDDTDFIHTLPNGRYGGFEMTGVFNFLSPCPVISLPIGLANGLPVGMQIVGQRFRDEDVLAVAAQIERVMMKG